MDTAVLLISLAGLLIGLFKIRRGKGFLDVLTGLVLVVVLSVYMGYFFYFGPRSTGDRFADNLASFDVSGIRNDLCSGTIFDEILSQIGGVFDVGLGAIGSADITRISNATYSPFTKEYRFSYSLTPPFAQAADLGHATVLLRSATPVTFCIEDLRGL